MGSTHAEDERTDAPDASLPDPAEPPARPERDAEATEDADATVDAPVEASAFCPVGLSGPTCATPCPSGTAGAACDFELVYRLNLPSSAEWTAAGTVPYSVDRSATIGAFSRVAYQLVLDDAEVWVELDAFTSDATKLGIPVGWAFQQQVNRVIVQSFSPNQRGILEPASGNIEMWPDCYAQGGDGIFDSNDVRVAPLLTPCYGSMQIHVGGHAVLAINRWINPEHVLDLGIGPAPTPLSRDWTFASNANTFVKRRLDVYVR